MRPLFIRTRIRTLLGHGTGADRRGEVVTYYQAVESYRDKEGKPRHRVRGSD